MIFSEEDINKAIVYGEIMDDLNQLHEEHGAPTMERGGPTTDTTGYDAYVASKWSPDSLGDWDCDVEAVSDLLVAEQEEVLDAINLGRYPYYYAQGEQWDSFEHEAFKLVETFEAERAWEIASQEKFEAICAAVERAD